MLSRLRAFAGSSVILGTLFACSLDTPPADPLETDARGGVGGQGGSAGGAGGSAAGGPASGTGGSGVTPQAGAGGSAGTLGSSGGTSGSGGSSGTMATGGAGSSSGGAPVAGSGGDAAGSGGSLSGAGGDTGGAGAGGAGDASGGGAGGGASGAGASSGKGGAGGASTGPITIWIAGDSTVANGNTPCPAGWGKYFDALFDDRVTVTNSAVGGRSVRTWLYNVGMTMDASGECTLATDSMGNPTIQARWQQMLTGMKAGDYLLIQFGINDGDSTCDRHVGITAFKSTYGVMAQAAKERGANPVFITPVSAVACNGSTARATRGGYVGATIEAGMTYSVPVIDLHALSMALYTERGFCPIPGGDVSASTTGPVGDFFCDDHTHFSVMGAQVMADVVAKAIRDQSLGLSSYLK